MRLTLAFAALALAAFPALAADADGEDFAEAIRRGIPGIPSSLDTWTGD